MAQPTMAATAAPELASPFLNPSLTSSSDSLAMIQLRRDTLLPLVLQDGVSNDGYAEGVVANTRYGSFPHSTLIGLPWGSQVRASKVDTGTRGRTGKKRKSRDEGLEDGEETTINAPKADTVKAAVEAGSGFVHILDPTPETWTTSLDHRTQVVYTHDYSYILPRIRARPGTRLIEAGAGSGSFTHAAVRAVFNGFKSVAEDDKQKYGQVYSFEYHEPRAEKLGQELSEHGLGDVVSLTHRDVCEQGFLLPDGSSPRAEAVFLDLPAPWQALRHLNRREPSALNPLTATHLCTFSPCIEQVTATVSFLRKSGWTDIEMVEVQNRRIDVRRDLIGLKFEGLHGVNGSAANVEEAIGRLRDIEGRFSEFRTIKDDDAACSDQPVAATKLESKQDRLKRIKKEAAERKIYEEGTLIHRTEPELRTHTSYLVFAILPRQWSEDDEQACLDRWPIDVKGSQPSKATE